MGKVRAKACLRKISNPWLETAVGVHLLEPRMRESGKRGDGKKEMRLDYFHDLEKARNFQEKERGREKIPSPYLKSVALGREKSILRGKEG